ncbi:MAG: alpha/beta hydrolase [Bacteroidota bacterium]
MKLLKWIGGLLVVLLIAGFFLSEGDLTFEEAKAVLADEQSQFVEIDGIQVHYKREGIGFPIVLVHGTGAILQTWDGWTKSLTANGYEVIRMDVQSFGLTGPPNDGDYSMEGYVDFLEKFIEEMAIDSFHLAGNSLGGQIAWEYAVKHQEEIGKLILSAPTGFSLADSKGSLLFTLSKQKNMAMLMKNVGTSFMVRNTLNDVYFDQEKLTEDMYEKYYAASRRAGNRDAFIYRLNEERVGNVEALTTLMVPTLLIWGDQDVLVSHTLAEEFLARIPDASLILYENMGHIPMEEIPEKTVADVLAFLSSPDEGNETLEEETP